MNQFTKSPIFDFVRNQIELGINKTQNSLFVAGTESTLKVVDLRKVNKKADQTLGYYVFK